jgi:hypothetical protein
MATAKALAIPKMHTRFIGANLLLDFNILTAHGQLAR